MFVAPSHFRPISALMPRVTKTGSGKPENRPKSHPGINVPRRCSTAEFRDGQTLTLFFVRLLRHGRYLPDVAGRAVAGGITVLVTDWPELWLLTLIRGLEIPT